MEPSNPDLTNLAKFLAEAPSDIRRQIYSKLPYPTLYNLCSGFPQLNICRDNQFWATRAKARFGTTLEQYEQVKLSPYLKYGYLYVINNTGPQDKPYKDYIEGATKLGIIQIYLYVLKQFPPRADKASEILESLSYTIPSDNVNFLNTLIQGYITYTKKPIPYDRLTNLYYHAMIGVAPKIVEALYNIIKLYCRDLNILIDDSLNYLNNEVASYASITGDEETMAFIRKRYAGIETLRTFFKHQKEQQVKPQLKPKRSNK